MRYTKCAGNSWAAEGGGPYGVLWGILGNSVGVREIRRCGMWADVVIGPYIVCGCFEGFLYGPPPSAAHGTVEYRDIRLIRFRRGRLSRRPDALSNFTRAAPKKVAASPRILIAGRQERRPLQSCSMDIRQFDTRAGQCPARTGTTVHNAPKGEGP